MRSGTKKARQAVWPAGLWSLALLSDYLFSMSLSKT
jgi:hypothetical protein